MTLGQKNNLALANNPPLLNNRLKLPNVEQLISDVNFLLQKAYITKKAMLDEMARRLQKDAGKYYQTFCRSISSPEATTRRFIDSFYSVFQVDLDSIKKGKQIQHASSSVELIKRYEDLLNSLFKAIENNTALVIANQKLVEAQLSLLTKLPDP